MRGSILRDPTGAEKVGYDLIIIGGGVQGALIALESVARGLSPLLLEKADFGSGTSGRSLRILHGGLRYLQTLDLPRFRESVEQRRWWIRTFPSLVRPLPCLMPLYGEGLRRKHVARGAFLLNDLLSSGKNQEIPEELAIPRGGVIDVQETIDRFPIVRLGGLEGAGVWHDASMESPHRLLMETLRWAVGGGATALNYVEASELLLEGRKVIGVRARDHLTGAELEYRSPVVVNAAGPWAAQVAENAGCEPGALAHASLAFNLLLARELPIEACVAIEAPGPGHQTYFLRPRGRFTVAGTGHASWPVGQPLPSRTPADLRTGFLREIRLAVPGFDVTERDVVRDDCGLLPAAGEGTQALARRPVVSEHGREGGPEGLVSVWGVKYTTAPSVARQVLEQIYGHGHGARREDFLRATPPAPPWRSPEEFERLRASDPEAAVEFLSEMVRNEAAVTVEDLVLRRLDWGLDLEDPESVAGDLTKLLGEEGPATWVLKKGGNVGGR